MFVIPLTLVRTGDIDQNHGLERFIELSHALLYIIERLEPWSWLSFPFSIGADSACCAFLREGGGAVTVAAAVTVTGSAGRQGCQGQSLEFHSEARSENKKSQ